MGFLISVLGMLRPHQLSVPKNPFVELEEESSPQQTLPVQCPDVPEQSTAHIWEPLSRTTQGVGRADPAAAHTGTMGHTRTGGLQQGTALWGPVG